MPFMRLLVIVLCMTGLSPASRGQPRTYGDEGQWKITSYSVVIRKSQDADATLTVTQGGKTLYRMSNAALWLNPVSFFKTMAAGASYDEQKKPHGIGQDVLKLGRPTLVVQGFSGGAHCCFDVTILYLGDHFRAMPAIPLFDAESVKFLPAKGREELVMSTADFTFAYWEAPFSDSSAAPVELGFSTRVHHYLAEPDLMRAPLPSQAEMDAKRVAARAAQAELQSEGMDWVPRAVTQPILDLIYTGHLKEALGFLDDVWSRSPEARNRYWSHLTTCQLRLSQFWPVVAKLNGLKPEKPADNCLKRLE